MRKLQKVNSSGIGEQDINQSLSVSTSPGAKGVAGLLEKEEAARTDLYTDKMKKGTNNILVIVRVRPLLQIEHKVKQYEIVRVMDQKLVILMDPAEIEGKEDILRIKRSKEKHFAFDFAFDQKSEQRNIYEKTCKFLVSGVIEGFNASVFAYGATGAGKTYTMLGTKNNPGMAELILHDLFNSITQKSHIRDYKVKLSYLEIYNENIKDLLNITGEVLDLREDGEKGMCVAGLSIAEATNVQRVIKQLRFGNKHRTQEATGANITSSRSHAILQILVQYKDKNSGIEAEIVIAKLSLIDLAGSERASGTNNRGIRMLEGANINRSLLALGNCINALSDNAEKKTANYVPYRDSKLTRLLKDSLGGNCRTVMVTNISPSNSNYEDTYNSLKYADRAKNIKTCLNRNVLNVQFHISQYTYIIQKLKDEISSLRKQTSIPQEVSQSLPKGGASGVNKSTDLIFSKEHMSQFEKLQLDVNSHFQEEAMAQRCMWVIRQQQEANEFVMYAKHTQYDNWGRINIAKVEGDGRKHELETEVKIVEERHTNLNKDYERIRKRMEELRQMREKLRDKLKGCKLSDRLYKFLTNQMKYQISLIDEHGSYEPGNQNNTKSIEGEAKEVLNMKEKQIQSLRHQLHMRDEIIARSKRLLEEHSIKYEFDESSFLKRSFDQSASHPANSSNSALQSGAKAQINHPFTIQKYTKTSGQHGNKGNISQDESTNFIPYNPANYSKNSYLKPRLAGSNINIRSKRLNSSVNTSINQQGYSYGQPVLSAQQSKITEISRQVNKFRSEREVRDTREENRSVSVACKISNNPTTSTTHSSPILNNELYPKSNSKKRLLLGTSQPHGSSYEKKKKMMHAGKEVVRGHGGIGSVMSKRDRGEGGDREIREIRDTREPTHKGRAKDVVESLYIRRMKEKDLPLTSKKKRDIFKYLN